MPTPKPTNLNSWRGLNNVLKAERTPVDYLKEIVNLDVSKDGSLHLRPGYTKSDSTSSHSLWSDPFINYGLVVRGGDLQKWYPGTDDFVTVRSSVGNKYDVSYLYLDGNVYYMTPDVSGIIDSDGTHRTWGIVHPTTKPTLAEASNGGLLQGRYQVAITYVSSDGRESGTTQAALIEISADNKSIQLTDIPTSSDSTVDTVRIYLSKQNGEILYWYTDISNGTSSYLIGTPTTTTTPLRTFNKYVPPNGELIRYHNGRIYIAQDNILWYSDKFQYELYDLRQNFMLFQEPITEVMPVDNGIWVCSDWVYYLSGNDPSNFNRSEKEPYKTVKGSGQLIPGAYIFIENTPLGYKWIFTTDKGMCIAFNDGVLLNTTEQNVAFPTSEQSTSAFIQMDGINRYVSLLKDQNTDQQNIGVGDQVSVSHIRNGVVIS